MTTATAHRMRRRRSLEARGLPTSSLTDAAPAREHVRSLQAQGMGSVRVADKAGVSRATVNNLLYGSKLYPPSKQIHHDTARRLLAVRLDPADKGRVCGAGTRRRLRALVAIGWTNTALAARLGWRLNNFTHLINNDDQLVHGATARKVRALYDELWDRTPTPATSAQRGAVTKARSLARRRGWVSPLAWDDDVIDDPEARPNLDGVEGGGGFDPAVVLLLAAGRMSASQAGVADRVAAVEALTAAGLSAPQIAERLGSTRRSVMRLRARAGRGSDEELERHGREAQAS